MYKLDFYFRNPECVSFMEQLGYLLADCTDMEQVGVTPANISALADLMKEYSALLVSRSVVCGKEDKVFTRGYVLPPDELDTFIDIDYEF